MKKVLTIITAIVIAAIFLTGCGCFVPAEGKRPDKNIVILVDATKSMSPEFRSRVMESVKSGLKDFIKPGDRISLYRIGPGSRNDSFIFEEIAPDERERCFKFKKWKEELFEKMKVEIYEEKGTDYWQGIYYGAEDINNSHNRDREPWLIIVGDFISDPTEKKEGIEEISFTLPAETRIRIVHPLMSPEENEKVKTEITRMFENAGAKDVKVFTETSLSSLVKEFI